MMLLPKPAARANQLDDNMIPLINIVFLMLIFFMIAGQLTASELITIQPPTSQQQSPIEEHDAVLLVSATAVLALDDALVEANALADSLQRKIADSKDPQTFKLLVKTDANVMATELTDLLKQVRAAGILKVSLTTQSLTDRHD